MMYKNNKHMILYQIIMKVNKKKIIVKGIIIYILIYF